MAGLPAQARVSSCAAVALAALAACGGGGSPPDDTVDRIEVTPAGFMLPGGQGSVQLGARVLARDGRVLDRPVTWRSRSPGVVAVTAAGLATASAFLGSAQLVAEAAGVTSPPVLALVAAPAGGAVLVQDAQVAGTPEAVDPAAALGLGWRYRVRLAGAAPLSAGALLLGTGAQPVGGRVVAVEPAGADQLVTLELVAPRELFEHLVVKETIDLRDVPPQVTPEAAPWVGLRRDPLGGWRAERFAWAEAEPPFGMPNVGPFSCASTVELPLVQVTIDTFHATPALDAVVDYDLDRPEGKRLRELRVAGGLDGELKAGYRLQLAPAAKLKCEARLFTIPLPITGWLAWLIGLNVPIGLGAELEESLSLDSVGVDVAAQLRTSLDVGVSCPEAAAGCQPVHSVTATATGSVEPKLPDLSTDAFTLTTTGSGYAIAKLAFGVPWAEALNVEAVEVKAGVKAAVGYRSRVGQATDQEYQASFDLAAFWQAEAASSVKWLDDLLEVKLLSFVVGDEASLAHFPAGTFTVSPATVPVGGTATFTVTLEESRWLGQDAVVSVDVLRERAVAGGGFELVPVCSVAPASGDQRVFTCTRSFGAAEAGRQVCHAFVLARDLGAELDLEVSKDARAVLQVGREPIHFEDPVLQERLEMLRGKAPLYPEDLRSLLDLPFPQAGISSLVGLEHATSLQTVNLLQNQVQDLTPLSGLTTLETVNLAYNRVADLSPLATLTRLTSLDVSHNLLQDIGAVAHMPGLQYLLAGGNGIEDLSPVADLAALVALLAPDNQIASLEPLRGHPDLLNVDLSDNLVADASPLSDHAALRFLTIDRNRLQSLPLTGLPVLVSLLARENQIASLAGMGSLPSLGDLRLQDNRLTDVGQLLLTGLASGSNLELQRNCLDLSSGSPAAADLAELDRRGVSVTSAPQLTCTP
jgi:hypothetical protein